MASNICQWHDILYNMLKYVVSLNLGRDNEYPDWGFS
jgi:hypothetical protein